MTIQNLPDALLAYAAQDDYPVTADLLRRAAARILELEKQLAHYHTLVPRMVEQMDRMEGALRGLENYVSSNLTQDYPTGVSCDSAEFKAARAALAELDRA